jgi:hypothetical protein
MAKTGQNMNQLIQEVEKAVAPDSGDPNERPMN